MEITQEILLINDVLNSSSYSEETLVQLILDICLGLDVPFSHKEQEFWKTKISYYLFNLVAAKNGGLIVVDQRSVSQRTCISWSWLLKVCIKSNIFGALFELLFKNLCKECFLLFVEKYCEEIAKSDLNDVIASFCIVITKLICFSDEGIATFLKNVIETLFQRVKSENILPIAEYHLQTLKEALKVLGKPVNQDTEDVNDLDLVVLKRLQKLSTLNISGIDLQVLIKSLQKPVLCESNLNSQQVVLTESPKYVEDLCQDLSILLEKYLDRLHKDVDEFSDLENDYCRCLQLFKAKLNWNNTISNPGLEAGDKLTSDHEKGWDVDSALFCATNLLNNYDEAVEYLLERLANGSFSHDVTNKCIRELHQVPECLMLSKHVLTLCKIIQQFEQNAKGAEVTANIACATELLSTVFALLPVSSKLALLNRRCDGKTTENEFGYAVFLLYQNKTDILQRKINLVFNKMTKTDAVMDFDAILHSVCNVAFLTPELTLKKTVGHIASHQKNHSLLVRLFESIPFLLRIESTQNENVLLKYLVQSVHDLTDRGNVIQNICNFISLLINSDRIDKDFVTYWTKQMLSGFILPFLSEKHNLPITKLNISLELALNLIKCVVHAFDSADCFDLCALVFHFACIVNESVTADGLLSDVKSSLIDVTDILCKCVQNEPVLYDSCCQWLLNASESLTWNTRLYLRPLLKNCKGYATLLPESLKQVCTLPETETLVFDPSYGEGTGLTAWLQCIMVDRALTPLSSLNVQELSKQEQTFFKHGLVVALTQVLPFCLEEDWNVILEALKSLLINNCLYVPYPLHHMRTLPFVNLEKFRNSLSILELLQQTTIILLSPCCRSWMSGSLWSRYARCYTIALKQMLDWDSRTDDEISQIQQQAFFLSQNFLYCCDFLVMLEQHSDCESARDSLYVLMLDLMSQFCVVYESASDESNTLMCELSSIHSMLLSSIKNIANREMQKALDKKLTSLL